MAMAWPITSSGALCDGVHDDTTAFQSALDFAYNTGGQIALGLPIGNCLLSGPLSYRGESIIGVSMGQSVITGAPHSDVFSAPDRSDSPASICCFQNTRLHDFTVMLDSSTDINSFGISSALSRHGQRGGAGRVRAQYSLFNTLTGWTGNPSSRAR